MPTGEVALGLVLLVLAMLPMLILWELTRTSAALRVSANSGPEAITTSADQRRAGPPAAAAAAAVPPLAVEIAADGTPDMLAVRLS